MSLYSAGLFYGGGNLKALSRRDYGAVKGVTAKILISACFVCDKLPQ